MLLHSGRKKKSWLCLSVSRVGGKSPPTLPIAFMPRPWACRMRVLPFTQQEQAVGKELVLAFPAVEERAKPLINLYWACRMRFVPCSGRSRWLTRSWLWSSRQLSRQAPPQQRPFLPRTLPPWPAGCIWCPAAVQAGGPPRSWPWPSSLLSGRAPLSPLTVTHTLGLQDARAAPQRRKKKSWLCL